MRRSTIKMRGFWGIVLCFHFIAGCSTYKQVDIGYGGGIQNSDEKKIDHLRVGQNVKIVLIDGRRTEGEVMEITEQEVLLGRLGNYGMETMEVGISSIAKIEVQEATTFLNIGIGVVFGTFLFVLVLGLTNYFGF